MAEIEINNIHQNGIEDIQEAVPYSVTKPNDAAEVEKPKFEIPLAKLGEVRITDYIKEGLYKVANNEGFQHYEINYDHGSAIGDGFVGIMLKACIREMESDKQLTVVIKTPPENLTRRNDFGAMELFKREVYMYNEVLPEFVKFQEERKINKSFGFFNFPKCYWADYDEEKNDSVIILEDLRLNGYKMWSKFNPVNYEHTKLLMEALGRLHGVSFAMKHQRPELYANYKELTDIMSDKMMNDNFEYMLCASIDRAIGTLDPNDTKKKARTAVLKQNLKTLLNDLTTGPGAEPYAIVTHGDCWINNFMYQYKRGKPDKIVLLDWQVSRYCSPVLDLVYFFFTCTDSEMREKHYDELLNLYHHSLKATLDHLGGDTATQFPFTAFLRHLKQYGKFGVIMASFLVPMLSIKNDELVDMDFAAENTQKNDPAMMEEMMKHFTGASSCEARLRGAFLDAMRFRYL